MTGVSFPKMERVNLIDSLFNVHCIRPRMPRDFSRHSHRRPSAFTSSFVKGCPYRKISILAIIADRSLSRCINLMNGVQLTLFRSAIQHSREPIESEYHFLLQQYCIERE